MATTDLERLLLTLAADFKQYEKAWAKAQGTTATNIKKMEREANAGAAKIQASMNKAGSALAGFGKGLALGAITGAVAGLGALITGAVQSAAAIGDLSDKLGISSDKLQELQYGAVQADLGFDEMEKGLLRFNKSLAEAQNGTGDLGKTLEANGFSKAEIQALSYSEALDVVADLIKNAKTEQDAYLITLQAFGKGGAGFVEFLRDGSEGLKKFATDAREGGAIVEKSLVESAQKFDDAWSAALIRVKAGITNWVLQSIPLIQRLNDHLEDTAKKWGQEAGFIAKDFGGTKFARSSQSGGFASPKSDRQPTTVVYDPEVAAAAKRAKEEAIRQYEREQKAITGVMESLKFENDQLLRSELQQRINNELRSAGVTATSEQGRAIADLVTKNFELEKSQEGAIEAGEKFIEAQEEFRDSLMNLAELGVDAFDAIIIGGEKAEDVLKDLVKQLAAAAIKAALLGSGPLAGLFGTGSSGGLFGALFGGARAGGGPVSAGKSYIVGEKRPEVFTPSQSGFISPRVGGGGQTINFAPVIDARGASIEAVQFLSERLDEISRNFARNVKSVVTNEKANNPRFAS